MTISFSGLASGLDTSSWVESLVALKQAKVETYEEERDNVASLQETLSSIKSFFSSFRSMLEKVTDAKFAIPSMDLFAQNLATSSDASILTAIATNEAEEATYNVLVDKLATETQVNSNHTFYTTIVETTTATADSKLTSLGVTAGNIGVRVNGIERGISITENDTIATFIEKLQNIGVEASYNEETGVFSMNVSAGDINDIDNTNIVDALKLDGVNEGFVSNKLETSSTETVFTPATGDTLLAELGVSNGDITFHANDNDFIFSVHDDSSINDLVNFLNDNNIQAGLNDDGTFFINDALITDDSTTNFINAFGLSEDIFEHNQVSNELNYNTIVTQVSNATSDTLISDIGNGVNITDGMIAVVQNNDGQTFSITVNQSSTIGDFIQQLNNAGIDASIDNSGIIDINGAEFIGGDFNAEEIFNLAGTVSTINVAATGETELSHFGISNSMSTAERTVNIYNDNNVLMGSTLLTEFTTLDNLVDFINSFSGVTAVLEDGKLNITGGYIENATLTAFMNLDKSFTGISILGSAMSTTTTGPADGNSTLGEIITALGEESTVSGGYTFNFNGHDLSVNENTTLNELISLINSNGGTASLDGAGRLIVTGGPVSGAVADAFGMKTESVVSAEGNSELYVSQEVNADRDTTLAELGITSSSDLTYYIKNSVTGESKTVVAPSNSITLGEFLDGLSAFDITGSINNGIITLNNNGSNYITGGLADALGIGTITETRTTSSQSSSGSVTYYTSVFADSTTQLGELSSFSSGQFVIYDSTDSILGTVTVSSTDTISNLFSKLNSYGITGSVSNGILSFTSAGGSYFNAGNSGATTLMSDLGISVMSSGTRTVTTGVTTTSTAAISYTGTFTADLSTTISDFATNATSPIYINNDSGRVATISLSSTDTINDLFDELSAYGITGSMSGGVMSFISDGAYYVTGNLMDELGISYSSTMVSGTIGKPTTSTVQITYTDTITATSNSTVNDLLSSSASRYLTIKSETGTSVGTITLSSTRTLDYMFDRLADYGITASLSGGVLSLDSADGNYITGDSALLSALGITTSSVLVTTTTGLSTTSSSAVTYTNTVTATLDSTLGEITGLTKDVFTAQGWGDNEYNGAYNLNILDDTGTLTDDSILLSEDSTVQEMFDELAKYGITGTMTNGVITLSSDSGKTVVDSLNLLAGALGPDVAGDMGKYGLFGEYGLDILNGSYTSHITTIGKQVTSDTPITFTATEYATEDTLLNELVSSSYITSGVTIKTSAGTAVTTIVMSSTASVGTLIETMANYGVNASIKDGVITIDNSNGFYASGSLLTQLGIGTNTTYTTSTVGLTATSTAVVTYTDTVVASTSSKLVDVMYKIDGTITASGVTGTVIGISTAAQLKYLADLTLASGDDAFANTYGKTFVLMNNISLSGYSDWKAIGHFYGTFDGMGYTISNMKQTVSSEDMRGGLFGSIQQSAVVKNLNLSNSTITVTGSSSNWLFVGPLACASQGTISGVKISNSRIYSPSDLNKNFYVGGLVGAMNGGTITRVSTSGVTLDLEKATAVGGLLGDIIPNENSGALELSSGSVGTTITTDSGNYWSGGVVGVISGSNGKTINIKDIRVNANMTIPGAPYLTSGVANFQLPDPADSNYLNINISNIYLTGSIDVGGGGTAGIMLFDGDTGSSASTRSTIKITGIVNNITMNNPNGTYDITNFAKTDGTTYASQISLTTNFNALNTAFASVAKNFGFSYSKWNLQNGSVHVYNDYAYMQVNTLGVASTSVQFTGTSTVSTIAAQTRYDFNEDTGRFFTNSWSPGAYLGFGYNLNNTTLTVNTTMSLNNDTTMANLGLKLTNYIAVRENGTLRTVTVRTTDTISSMLSKLADYGITGSVSGGGLTLEGSDSSYITAMSINLRDALDIRGTGSGYTWRTSVSSSSTNTDSKELTYDTVKTLTESDTFADLGITSDQYVTVMGKGTVYTITVHSTDTVGDFVYTLKIDCGVLCQLSNGSITITGGTMAGGVYAGTGFGVLGMSSQLENALHLNVGAGNSYTTEMEVDELYTPSKTFATEETATLTGETTLSDFGIIANQCITVSDNGTHYTITITPDMTMSEMLSSLSNYGITGSISDGKLTLEGDENSYITSMYTTLQNALKLSVGSGNTYSTSSDYHYSNNTSSSPITYEKSFTFKNSTTMGDLGISSEQYITINDNGTSRVVTVSSSSTLSNMLSQLSNYGITGSVSNGYLTSQGSTDSYITGMSTSLKNALGLQVGSGYTYQSQNGYIYSIDSSDAVEYTKNVTVTGSTTAGDLGITSNQYITVINNGTSRTVTVNASSTIDNILSQLSSYGIDSSLSNGRLSLEGSDTNYITGISSTLADALGLKAGNGSSYTTSVYTGSYNSSSDPQYVEESNYITETTRLSDIYAGFSGATIAVKNTSGSTVGYVTLNSSDTIEDMLDKLAAQGISGNVNSTGRITLSSSNGYSIEDYNGASGLLSALKIGSATYTTTNGATTNTDSSQQKYNDNTAASVNDRLGDLLDNVSSGGISSSGYDITLFKNDSSQISHTFSANSTIQDVIDWLETQGVEVETAQASPSGYLKLNITSFGDNTNITGGLADFLFSAGGTDEYTTTTSFASTTTSTNLGAQSGAIMSDSSLLADFGITGGNIKIVQDGITSVINLDLDNISTVKDFRDLLSGYGFNTSVTGDGRLSITASGNTYLESVSGGSNIIDILGLDNMEYVGLSQSSGELQDTAEQSSYVSSEPVEVIETSSQTDHADRDTLLSDLGITSGEFYVYNNGVKYTALISSDDTLGSLMNTLNSFGLQTSLTEGADGSVLRVLGSGDSYVAKSNSAANASNVVDVLFPNGIETSKTYTGTEQTSQEVTTYTPVTEDTLLSEFDQGLLAAQGDLSVTFNGVTSTIKIESDETFGSLLEKFRALGVEATLSDGQIMLQSGYNTFTINTDGTTSNLQATIGLVYQDDLGGYVASSDTVLSTVTTVEERTLSVANYADGSTQLGSLNISDGTLTVYKDGQRAVIQVNSNETFDDLRSRLASAFSDLDLRFDDGYLTIFSKDGSVIDVGATTDTSNFSAITGISKNAETGEVVSARELYRVNGDSVLTQSGLFRTGTVTEGTFTIGDATFTIGAATTLSDIISQINTNDDANATAYWDNVDGKLVIQSRTTGAALVNIEAGTSNFTDIMGFTTSEWNADGSLDVTRMNISNQQLGSNARVTINGTTYTAMSNTITSDISRIKGLTINLHGLTEGSAITLTVERDKETLANAISDVVDSYNELMNNVDESIAIGGDLHSESTLKLIRNQLRSFMTSSDVGATVFRNLDSIGISVADASANNISTSTESIVYLTFDKDKFLEAYEADQTAVKELLIGGDNNQGIFTKVEELVESALQSVTGYFDIADTSFTREINRIDDKITKANAEIERYRERLEAKFNSMDLLIAQMQQQYSSFLTV